MHCSLLDLKSVLQECGAGKSTPWVKSQIQAVQKPGDSSKGIMQSTLPRKTSKHKHTRTARKPTQVVRASSPRRTSEMSPRNSAKSGRTFGIRPSHAAPHGAMRDAAKVSLATVYQKHSSLRTRKRMYRG